MFALDGPLDGTLADLEVEDERVAAAPAGGEGEVAAAGLSEVEGRAGNRVRAGRGT